MKILIKKIKITQSQQVHIDITKSFKIINNKIIKIILAMILMIMI